MRKTAAGVDDVAFTCGTMCVSGLVNPFSVCQFGGRSIVANEQMSAGKIKQYSSNREYTRCIEEDVFSLRLWNGVDDFTHLAGK